MRLTGHVRVTHRTKDSALGPGVDQGLQQPDRVAGTAPTRVVLRVGQHYRARTPRCQTYGFSYRAISGQHLCHKAAAPRHHGVAHSIGRAVGLRLIDAVGHHSRPDIGDIREVKPDRDTDSRHCLIDCPRHSCVHIPRRTRDARAPSVQGNQKAGLAISLAPALPIEHPQQQPRRACTGFAHVDVRVGAEDFDRITVHHHRLGEVGVHVEAHRHRHIRPDHRTHTAQNFTFAVGV